MNHSKAILGHRGSSRLFLRTSCLLLLTALAVGPRAEALDSCRTLKLDPQPYWVSSATWSADGGELLVVDVVRKAILRYSPDTGVGQVSHSILETVDGAAPTLVQCTGDGYLVEEGDGRFVRRTPGFEMAVGPQTVVEVVGVATSGKRPSPRLGSVNSWVAQGDNLLLYGDIQRADGTWTSAFTLTTLGSPSRYRILKDFDLDDPARELYLVGQNYITSTAGIGYFLVLDESPSLWAVSMDRLDQEPRQLSAFATDIPAPPDLSRLSSFDNVREEYAVLEQAVLPVSVFGNAGQLFLLVRRPGAEGGVSWELTVIDPQEDRVLRTLRLPTSSPHVTVVPGDGAWAVLEKQSVESLGVQEIPRALLIPAPWIEAPNSPLELGVRASIDCAP